MMTSGRGKWKFKSICLLLALLLLSVTQAPLPSQASEAEEVKSETQLTQELGLMTVVGDAATYWSAPETRMEAALTFLRIQGLEQSALTFDGTANFADAGEVAVREQAVLAFLKAHPSLGWVGVGGNRFEPLAGLTAQQLEKIRLAALGYEESADFTYAAVRKASVGAGLTRAALWDGVSRRQFAAALVELLKQPVKGTGDKLVEVLVKAGRMDIVKTAAFRYPTIRLLPSDSLGAYLADSKGMALYARMSDAPMASACIGACVADWPLYAAGPLLVPAELQAADFGMLIRGDGARQTTYKGMPLYHFIRDFVPGDAKGEGIQGSYTVKAPVTFKLSSGSGERRYLTDGDGRTLYYNNLDPEGSSTCSSACLLEWPVVYTPYIVVSLGLTADDFGIITRDDGIRQMTFKGFPLYYSQRDTRLGEAAGNGANEAWFVLFPSSFSGTSVSHGLAQRE